MLPAFLLSVPVANWVVSESVEEEEAEHTRSCAAIHTDNQKQEKGHTQTQIEAAVSDLQ